MSGPATSLVEYIVGPHDTSWPELLLDGLEYFARHHLSQKAWIPNEVPSAKEPNTYFSICEECGTEWESQTRLSNLRLLQRPLCPTCRPEAHRIKD